MSEKKYDIEDKLVGIAAETILFVKDLPYDYTDQYYSNQLMRSTGSAALNLGEAQGTNSTKNYIHKASLTIKELKESRVNLKILAKVQFGKKEKRATILDEVEQLIRIISSIINNKKNS